MIFVYLYWNIPPNENIKFIFLLMSAWDCVYILKATPSLDLHSVLFFTLLMIHKDKFFMKSNVLVFDSCFSSCVKTLCWDGVIDKWIKYLLDPQHPHKPACNLSVGARDRRIPGLAGHIVQLIVSSRFSQKLSNIRWRVID